jgi:kinesin family protein 2/24
MIAQIMGGKMLCAKIHSNADPAASIKNGLSTNMLSDALPSQLRQRLDSRNGKAPAAALAERERPEVGKENAARTAPAARPAPSPSPSQCVREVERMRMRRAAMREAVEEQRRIRGSDDGTAEFQQMITDFRRNLVLNPALAGRATAEPAAGAPARRIRVAVRKRPLLPHELESAAYDTVTCAPDGKRIVVHEPKTRVDLQKCMESHAFEVDDVFSDAASTSDVYDQTVGELVAAMFDGCSSTCFTYGQTGSGKTYTMLGKGAAEADVDALACACADDLGLYHLAARDCFEQLEVLRREGVALYLGVSFFEVYCGGVHDLLNGRRPCRVLEDAQGEVVVRDLEELVPDSLQHMLQVRTRARTHARTRAGMHARARTRGTEGRRAGGARRGQAREASR